MFTPFQPTPINVSQSPVHTRIRAQRIIRGHSLTRSLVIGSILHDAPPVGFVGYVGYVGYDAQGSVTSQGASSGRKRRYGISELADDV